MLKTMLSEHLCLWITLPQNMCFGKRCYCKLKQSLITIMVTKYFSIKH